ncbi:hydroxyethylthiazole kinase [Tianweitania populi]|uniref:hydroxyethylthiazole kinase n=1 Tax=Tianweitania populi TaxID=1607949 RepID=A0A8J3DSI1_9HYPH|nr:hydroxyethylthiazole kinase [Tianweitania populi]GHD20903.1 putative hydroxyethylthiazole kinase [Tianweitania populi]
MSLDIDRLAALPERLRKKGPRVHCLLNTVAQKFVADGLSAIGCTPSMTSSLDEVAQFTERADALLVNLGTSTPEMRETIAVAVSASREASKPFILDPVKAYASTVRHDFAKELIAREPYAVKLNRAEMDDLHPVATPHMLVVETGSKDRITNGETTVAVENGHPWLAMVTATGCLAGAVIAAAAAVEDDPLHAGIGAMALLGIGAEMAAQRSRGPGTFAPELLDALASIEADDIRVRLRLVHD